ncbi:hypothetical protein ANN_09244 [Periplaneta americana]|uniref:Uncharacterized protein n=1 Tax=Periplaneta americana TaxID=6978 RepID=A0ABQ8TPD1_PERAM|nr:hypothetical protein ANN_09244 [Periplaneta americana]
MAFIGKEPIRTKIAINNCSIEQVSHFNYLGSDIGFDKEYDVDNKIRNFQRVCGTITRTFRNKIRKETKLKFYKVMAVPTLAYGNETWTLTKKQQSKIQTTEMKFLRNVKGCTKRDLITNENIREELEIFNINERLKDFKHNWKERVDRMPDTRLTKQIIQYHPKGRRSVSRPRKDGWRTLKTEQAFDCLYHEVKKKKKKKKKKKIYLYILYFGVTGVEMLVGAAGSSKTSFPVPLRPVQVNELVSNTRMDNIRPILSTEEEEEEEDEDEATGVAQSAKALAADPELRSGAGSIPAWADYLVGFFPRFSPTIRQMSDDGDDDDDDDDNDNDDDDDNDTTTAMGRIITLKV